MFKFKSAISPVIAVILLLAITVTISISMYSFLQNYTEDTTSSLDSNAFNQIKVIGVYNNNLYLDSSKEELFSVFQIKDLNSNIQCEISDSKQSTFQLDTKIFMTFDNETFNGTHVLDNSGYDNHGLINGSSYSESNCISSGCFNFDGDHDGIITTFNESLQTFSFSIWLKLNNLNKVYPYFVGMGDGSSGDDPNFGGWFFTGLNNNDLRFEYIHNSTNGANSILINDTLEANSFDNYVVSFDNGKLDLYKNAQLIHSTNDISNIYYNESYFSFDSLFLGRMYNTITPGHFLNGTLDEFSFYSKSLNEGEVNLLYNLKQAKFYEQLIGTQTKEINISNCNLNKNSKYEFVGILNSGLKISEKFVVN